MNTAAACGMTESEFWDSTPRFLSAKVNAYEESQKLSWEQTRFIAFHAIKPADSKNRLKKFTDLVRFPWEKVPKRKQTPEEIEAAKKFNEEDSDKILAATNPEAYTAYMAAKEKRNV